MKVQKPSDSLVPKWSLKERPKTSAEQVLNLLNGEKRDKIVGVTFKKIVQPPLTQLLGYVLGENQEESWTREREWRGDQLGVWTGTGLDWLIIGPEVQ